MTKLAVVIACHNEQEHIAAIVRSAKKCAETVIVVDDHSSDDTRGEAEGAGALVIANTEARKGVGIATRLGIRNALERQAEVIVTLDGDGQHDPEEIAKVAELVLKGEADMVIGKRSIQVGSMPFYRRIGNGIINEVNNLGSFHRVGDSMSGFRAYSGQLLRRLEISEDGFEYIPEILIKAKRSGARIREVPIACIYHESLQMNSSMRPLEHGIRMVLAVAKWRIRLALKGRKPNG